MINNLPVYLNAYRLQIYLYQLVRCFRKEHKYTLGRDILEMNWRVLDAIIKANSLPNNEKAPAIRDASAAFDQLKSRLRMAHELKLIPHKHLAGLAERNAEIGKMLAGWLKWAEKMQR